MENPYKPPNVRFSVSPSYQDAPSTIHWRSVMVATLIDGGTATGFWVYGMINRMLYGMRYVSYTSEIENEMIAWTIISAIPAVMAATYVVTKSKQSWFLTLLVYCTFRTLIVAGLSWELIAYLELQHYFMYTIYIGFIGFLGIGLSWLISWLAKTNARTNNPMDPNGGSAAS